MCSRDFLQICKYCKLVGFLSLNFPLLGAVTFLSTVLKYTKFFTSIQLPKSSLINYTCKCSATINKLKSYYQENFHILKSLFAKLPSAYCLKFQVISCTKIIYFSENSLPCFGFIFHGFGLLQNVFMEVFELI